MLKIGILGVGHLGKIHLRLLQQIPDYQVVGFYDPDDANAQVAVEQFGVKRFDSIKALLAAVNVVDIVSPTIAHYECAVAAVTLGKHVFIEKPFTSSLQEAEQLITLIEEIGVKAQIGHVERFNPAFLAAQDKLASLQPLFIETHRLAQFNPRGNDVSVVLDLMIHDLDIILNLVQAPVKNISANGVAAISKSSDIANARIEFINGCVANITASRLSLKNMRKTRIFQQDAYVSIDFLNKKTEVIQISEQKDKDKYLQALELPSKTEGENKFMVFDFPKVTPVNAIEMELQLFAKSILQNTPEVVSMYDGYNAMKLAYQIMEVIEQQSQVTING